MALLGRRFNTGTGLVRILTMNTLADACADQTPMGFPFVDFSVLQWDHRKHLLIQEITQHDPDFICLQEVDHWEDWFQPELYARGYDGVWSKLEGRHGCVLAWKMNIWTPIAPFQTTRLIEGNGQLMVAGTLSDSKRAINLVTTHFKAKKPFAAVRLQQGEALLMALPDNGYPTIVAGDFNASPDEPVIELLAAQFKSVYDFTGYTTAKMRGPEITRHMIDYIWIRDLTPKARLEIPPIEKIPPPCLPRADYPSDHFALVADLE